jgi:beta-glucosidase
VLSFLPYIRCTTLAAVVLVCLFPTASASQLSPEQERRINALIARMTLEEKIGQMSQATTIRTPLSDKIKDEIRKGRWGSFLNAGSPEDRAEAQRIALKESRLGIPLLFGRDVIHGYKTIFPIPLGQSASWDPALIQKAARIAAQEATAEGIRWTFAPMIDITHDPRWGRIAETLGEDPYLTGVLGAAMIRGFQGESLSDPASLAACAKHFAGYGAAEAGRDYNSTWIPEIQLRELFLPPFRAAVDAGVASVMTAFNALNGIPATGNRFLLAQILRGEWKYGGLVVSDYEAIPEMIEHGYARDAADAALKAVRAGVDMEMVSTTYYDHLRQLLQAGKLDIKAIDESVRRILRLKFELGLFDLQPRAGSAKVTPESRAVAKQLASESVVLLKNEGNVLPFSDSIAKLAVIGPLADSPADQLGTWTMDGRPEDAQTPLQALRQMLGEDRVVYAKALRNSRDLDRSGFGEALNAARSADAVVLFLGEEQILSGEARSRAFLNLPGAQEALVEEVAKSGKPMVAVIMAGRPTTFDVVARRVRGLLYAWHPGTMGGPAIADLLFGNASPSGKLTVSFPRTVGQVPIYYNHLNTGRPASTQDLGIPMGNPANPQGYTSKYIDVDFTPAYPFGFGLSYTNFVYSGLRFSTTTMPAQGTVTVTATVTNEGNREADEVVQLYVRNLGAEIPQPVRQLKGFERIRLRPGASQQVRFKIARTDLAYYDENMRLKMPSGRVQVWVAPDSTRGLQGEIKLP